MEKANSTLLPYIMDLLSRKPDLCCSVNELVDHVKDAVMNDYITPHGNVRKSVEFALKVGMNLGLISLSNYRVRAPFNFRATSNAKVISSKSSKSTLKRRSIRNLFGVDRQRPRPRPRPRPKARQWPSRSRNVRRNNPLRYALHRYATRRPKRIAFKKASKKT